MLQEGIGDHGHQRVTMKALSGSPLKVIKPELLFQLLMRLFANAAGFGRRFAVHAIEYQCKRKYPTRRRTISPRSPPCEAPKPSDQVG